jgi:hypothetical protein
MPRTAGDDDDGNTACPSRSSLYLRSNVFAAAVDEDVVILDLDRDDYLCIPDGSQHFRPASEHGPAEVLGPLAQALHDHGLACVESGTMPSRVPAVPSRSVLHERPVALTLSDMPALAIAVLKVRAAEKRTGISSQIAVAGSRAGEEDAAAVLRAASAFWGVQPWLPFDGECLQRSMLLVAFLRELGLRADWVFAVRLWPFSAHCWVQCGEVCLNDDHERLRAYTPIYCL